MELLEVALAALWLEEFTPITDPVGQCVRLYEPVPTGH